MECHADRSSVSQVCIMLTQIRLKHALPSRISRLKVVSKHLTHSRGYCPTVMNAHHINMSETAKTWRGVTASCSFTTTFLLRPPLFSGHLSFTVTFRLRPPLFYDHLSFTATRPLWPPFFSGHLSFPATSHFRPPDFSGHLSFTATFLLRPPFFYGHLSFTTTVLFRPPFFSGHLSFPATLLRPHNVILRVTVT